MSLTSYRAAPPRVKPIDSMRRNRGDMDKEGMEDCGKIRLEDLATTYSPVP